MPNNKEYLINNYIYTELNNQEIVLQNKDGIVRIHNEMMKNLIRDWDTKTGQTITEEYLVKYFQHKYQKAMEFLLNYKILKIKNTPNYNINRINFLTTNCAIYNFAKELLMNDYSHQLQVKISELQSNNISSNDLVVVFLNPYSKKAAKQILDEVKAHNDAVLLMSYIYNNNFYIDSLYSKNWRNPCHFCHIGHIESQLRITQTGNLTYQHLIDVLYHEDDLFKVEANLSYHDIFSILSLLVKQIDKFFIRDTGFTLRSDESIEEINNCLVMDLKSKNISVDTGIYWELCDCYE